MDNITVCLVTYSRLEHTKNTIKYLLEAGFTKIIIAYNGPEELYESHKNLADKYSLPLCKYKYNIGLPYCRNRLLDKVDTKYTLLISDDEYIYKDTAKLLPILEKHNELVSIGIPSCNEIMENYRWKAFNFELIGKTLNGIKPENITIDTVDGYRVAWGFDYVPINPTIFKSYVFDDVRFDEKIRLKGEHTDFYLTMKKLHPEYRNGISLDIHAYHKKYKNQYYHNDKQVGNRYLFIKWGVGKLNFMHNKDFTIDHIYIPYMEDKINNLFFRK